MARSIGALFSSWIFKRSLGSVQNRWSIGNRTQLKPQSRIQRKSSSKNMPSFVQGKYFIQSGSVEKYSRRLNPYHLGLMEGEDAAATGPWLAAAPTVGSLNAGSAATNAEEPRYFSMSRRFTRGISRSALVEKGESSFSIAMSSYSRMFRIITVMRHLDVRLPPPGR